MREQASASEEFVQLVLGVAQEGGVDWSSPTRGASEHGGEDSGQFLHCVLHSELDQPQRSPVVEQDHQDDASGNICQVQRLLLALMEQGTELLFSQQPSELIVGRKIG